MRGLESLVRVFRQTSSDHAIKSPEMSSVAELIQAEDLCA